MVIFKKIIHNLINKINFNVTGVNNGKLYEYWHGRI